MRVLPKIVAALGCAALLPNLQAQSLPERIRALPDVVLHASFDGPGSLVTKFIDTNLGAMLASPEMAELRDEFMTTLRAEMDEDAPDPRAEEMLRLFGDYRGRVTAAFAMSAPGAGGDFEDGDARLFVFMEDDEDEVASEIAELVREVIDEESEEAVWDEFEIGAHTFEVASRTDESSPVAGPPAMLPPRHIEGGVFFAFGDDLRAGLESLFGDEVETTSGGRTTTRARQPIEIEFEAGRFLGWVPQTMDDDEEREMAQEVLADLGLMSMQSIGLTLSPNGVYTEQSFFATESPGDARGLLDRFLPSGRASTIGLAPIDADNWTAMRLGVPAIVRAVLDIVRRVEGDETIDQMETMMQQQVGFGIDDLLGTLGVDFLYLPPPTKLADAVEAEMEGGNVEAVAEDMLSLSFAMSLADAEAFEGYLDKAMRSMGLHAAVRTQDYRGIAAKSMPALGFVPVHYAISDGYLVLGLGKKGEDDIRRVLDRLIDRRGGREDPDFSGVIGDRVIAAPEGWVGMTVSQIPFSELDQLSQAMRSYGLDPADEEPMVGLGMRAFELAGRLGPQFDLGHSVTLIYRDPDRMRSVTIW